MTTGENQKTIGNSYEPYKEMCIHTIMKYFPFYTMEDLVLLPLWDLADLTQKAMITGGR